MKNLALLREYIEKTSNNPRDYQKLEAEERGAIAIVSRNKHVRADAKFEGKLAPITAEVDIWNMKVHAHMPESTATANFEGKVDVPGMVEEIVTNTVEPRIKEVWRNTDKRVLVLYSGIGLVVIALVSVLLNYVLYAIHLMLCGLYM